MASTALSPVFVGLRTGLHALFVGLAILVIVRAIITPTSSSLLVLALAALLLVTYIIGAIAASTAPQTARAPRLIWLAALTLEWVVLLWLIPDAAYLAFPLFFLYLSILGRGWGAVAIAVTALLTIYAIAAHGGWSLAGIIGPLIGAGVALLIGLGYQALAHEAARRETLMRELLATRGQLAATEHESGVLAERARLAREIHDTLAQGLSSIQLLLHAAERTDPDRPGVEHIRLARETAAENLVEARRFIRELTPPDLEDRDLGGALRRLAEAQWEAQGLRVDVRVSDTVPLPMHLQTALLRIAQGAIANVIQHADATTAVITLSQEHDLLHFSISDDGRGFTHTHEGESARRPNSFGLRATAERVQQLGGELSITSDVGEGTTIAVELSLEQLA